MAEEFNCPQCASRFSSGEALAMHSAAKHVVVEKPPLVGEAQKKTIKHALLAGVVLLALAGVAYWWIATPHYQDPPFKYTGQPHPETHPASNFLDEPIPVPVQVHILEHAPTLPGALVQYNCQRDKPECVKLAADLKRVVSSADSQKLVFVAPYYQVDSLIVLTGNGKILKLASFDEGAIKSFLNSIGIR